LPAWLFSPTGQGSLRAVSQQVQQSQSAQVRRSKLQQKQTTCRWWWGAARRPRHAACATTWHGGSSRLQQRPPHTRGSTCTLRVIFDLLFSPGSISSSFGTPARRPPCLQEGPHRCRHPRHSAKVVYSAQALLAELQPKLPVARVQLNGQPAHNSTDRRLIDNVGQ